MPEITARTARLMAQALREYDKADDELKLLRDTADEAKLVRAAERWARAARFVYDCRTQLEHEERAVEIAVKQASIFARNLAWLKKHHPNDPRIPQIEQSLTSPRQRLSTDEPSRRDAGAVPDQTEQREDR